jgi:hypothetical protein
MQKIKIEPSLKQRDMLIAYKIDERKIEARPRVRISSYLQTPRISLRNQG